ncbi:MAG: hypothetical protein ABI640_13175 [Gammaproteobacteria bacterium]
MSARVGLVTRQPTAEHPHALLLAVAQHVLRGLRQRRVPVAFGDTGYRADPEHFAMQMEVFDRMRETERAFRQLTNGSQP